MKKALFIDLDGTLLKGSNHKKISKKNINYITKLQQQECFVVVCTGRSRKEAVEAAKIIRYNNFGNFTIYGGGTVFENIKDNKVIEFGNILNEDIKKAIEIAKEYNLAIKLDGIDAFFISKNKTTLMQRIVIKFSGYPRKNLDKMIIPSKTNKIGFLSSNGYEKNKELRRTIMKKYPQFEVNISGKGFYLELTPKGYDKGSMIKKAIKHLGVNIKNTAAVGDSMNDYSMFKVVNTPIAMKNSNNDLKEISEFVTKNNKKHGVAHSEKFLK
jgi:Cof subfamily protein (haloacid dehalogenase superfamily)